MTERSRADNSPGRSCASTSSKWWQNVHYGPYGNDPIARSGGLVHQEGRGGQDSLEGRTVSLGQMSGKFLKGPGMVGKQLFLVHTGRRSRSGEVTHGD
jgi:hypothetical protein